MQSTVDFPLYVFHHGKNYEAYEFFGAHPYSEENKTSFTALNVLKGEGKADGNPFKAGDSFFVPCGEKFTLEGKAEIVLTTEGKE